MSRVTLVTGGQAADRQLDPALLTTLLHAMATAADAPEHITVQARCGRVELVFFHTVDSAAEAAEFSRGLCRRALEEVRRIGEWAISDLPE